ncbi:phospholipid/cholesterol/gamma-HCH transport system substrate-binding protein [Alphaproteobacteria bacterium]
MSNSKSIIETLVGAIVLGLCVAFITIVYRSGSVHSGNQKSYYVLSAAFERADGIGVGSSITISGIKVGQVVEQTLDKNTYSAIIKMSVDAGVNLPVDTSAEIVSSSLLGDKYVALVPGAETEYLKHGDAVEFTQSSISLESLISKVVFGMEMNTRNYDVNKNDAAENNENSSEEEENHSKQSNVRNGAVLNIPENNSSHDVDSVRGAQSSLG